MQVGALCWRKRRGQTEVLLVTSRESGRWVVPKGWPMEGRSAAGAAMQEAWEEAGVRVDPAEASPAGQFDYIKRLKDGRKLRLTVHLYRVRLRKSDLHAKFPEAKERKRTWMTARKAASKVEEPGLRKILGRL
ncbi:NUDIX hydrolase [Roseovarius sp. D22-M7]|uniref:NUDIX hydrolase n=1 Tax=Roseovarius sp. D22-M7 TaxID=3127116 RepID=UPI00300FADA9